MARARHRRRAEASDCQTNSCPSVQAEPQSHGSKISGLERNKKEVAALHNPGRFFQRQDSSRRRSWVSAVRLGQTALTRIFVPSDEPERGTSHQLSLVEEVHRERGTSPGHVSLWPRGRGSRLQPRHLRHSKARTALATEADSTRRAPAPCDPTWPGSRRLRRCSDKNRESPSPANPLRARRHT
jgi:hypothetical protein